MSLITIQRKIHLALPDELKLAYVEQQVYNEYPEEGDISGVPKAICGIIDRQEAFHKAYGIMQENGMLQATEECMVPAYTEPSGYSQWKGIIVVPFDWSWEDNGDYDYTFYLARVI